MGMNTPAKGFATARRGSHPAKATRHPARGGIAQLFADHSTPNLDSMNWDNGQWDSGTWDQPSDYFSPQTKSNNRTKMRRQTYYPSRIGDQVNWLDNYAVKLPIHGAALGVIAGDITASVNDAKYANYVLGTWLSAVRNFSPSTTDAVDDVLAGGGSTPMVLPTFTAPALPAGVTAALPGTLTRIFALIAKMKLSAGYTEAIGTDLGIVGSAETEKALPKFSAELIQGGGCQCVKLSFYKYNHMGVYIEGRRGTGAWEFLAIDTESPYIDERPLLAAGTPEVREYRMRFWDKGTPNGDWTDVVKVTVSP
jgi:hypothetical protein